MSASLGGAAIQSVNDAVQNLYAAGITPIVAAGNENTDACTRSPASAPNAITVGASNSTDARASFSNYGNCVDVFAPGVAITSDNAKDPTTPVTWNGTSMATPHVSGLAALYLASNKNASPAEVTAAIMAGAQVGVITNSLSLNNNLINNRFVKATLPPVGSPTGVTVSQITGTTATVSWAAPVGTQAAQSYNLEYKAAADTTWTLVPVLVGTLTTLTGLTNNATYSVRVSSVDGTVVSAPSAEVMFSTVGLAPTPPTNIRTTSIFGNQATLAWDAGLGNGAAITKYNLYQMDGTTKGKLWVAYGTGLTVSGLLPSTSYTVAIESVNINGTSALSAPFTFTTTVLTPAQVGQIKFSNITSTTATATWNPVAQIDPAVPISYTVKVYVYTLIGKLLRQTLTTSNTTIDLVNLSTYATHYLVITAYSGTTASPDSSFWGFNTLASAPGAVTAFSFNRTNANSYTLVWSPPASSGGSPVTGYQIDKQDATGAWVAVSTQPVTAGTLAIPAAVRNQPVTYRIAAINALGTGAYKSVIVTAQNTPPGKVASASGVQSVDLKSVTLTWTAPTDDGGSPITGYRIMVGATPTTVVSTVVSLNASYLNITVPVNVRGDSYFAVVPINALGVGTASDPIKVSRPFTVPSTPVKPNAVWNADGTLKVYWYTPADTGGQAITAYTLERLEGGAWVTKYTGTALTTNIPRDASGSIWQYRITAANATGSSLPSEATSIQVPFSLPGVPTNVEAKDTGTAVVLSYTAPVDLGGGAVRYYTAQLSKDGGATWLYAGNGLSATLTVARPAKGQTWQYRVAVANQTGVGAYSAPVPVTAGVTVPGYMSFGAGINIDGTITLKWSNPVDNGGQPITSIVIEKSLDGTNWTALTMPAAGVFTMSVPQEAPGVRVYFRASSQNATGTSAFTTSILTMPYVKAAAPTGFTVVDNGSYVVATWTGSANRGGSTSITYYVQTSVDGTTWKNVAGVSNTSTGVISLTTARPAKGTSLQYRLIAKTSWGLTDPSAATTIAAALTVPSSTFSSTFGLNADKTATAVWRLPTDNGGTPLTAVRYFTSIDGTNWSAGTDLAATATTVTLPALAPGARLWIRVHAVNSVGMAPTAQVLQVSVPVIISNAVASVTVTASGQTVTGTWTAPTYAGGATSVTYSVYTSLDGTNFVFNRTTTATSIQFSGLAKGLTVYIRVTVRNAAGESAPLTGSAMVPLTAPSTASGLLIQRTSATNVNIGFNAPYDLGGVATWSYKVQQLVAGTWTTVATGTGVAGFNIVSIASNQSTALQYFRVITGNQIGDAAASYSVVIR
jgi:titin